VTFGAVVVFSGVVAAAKLLSSILAAMVANKVAPRITDLISKRYGIGLSLT